MRLGQADVLAWNRLQSAAEFFGFPSPTQLGLEPLRPTLMLKRLTQTSVCMTLTSYPNHMFVELPSPTHQPTWAEILAPPSGTALLVTFLDIADDRKDFLLYK
jgi:hypothetical protein